jgi:hypothetical protein
MGRLPGVRIDEAEPGLAHERLDLTQRQVLLLDMERQVATVAHRLNICFR